MWFLYGYIPFARKRLYFPVVEDRISTRFTVGKDAFTVFAIFLIFCCLESPWIDR